MTVMAHTHTGIPAHPSRLFGGVGRLPAVVVGWLMYRFEVARSRRALLALSDRMLKDIGLDRATAQREGEKGFWG